MRFWTMSEKKQKKENSIGEKLGWILVGILIVGWTSLFIFFLTAGTY